MKRHVSFCKGTEAAFKILGNTCTSDISFTRDQDQERGYGNKMVITSHWQTGCHAFNWLTNVAIDRLVLNLTLEPYFQTRSNFIPIY